MNSQFLGKFHAHDNNGALAAGYKVWAYAPGTSTPASTFPTIDCTAGTENPWPVVLDTPRGEFPVYVNTGTDLYFTLPSATDASSYIWKVENYGKQQGVPPISATIDAATAHNYYQLTSSPAATSLVDLQSIKFLPDANSVSSLVTVPPNTSPTVFTGTGINDGVFSGPYTGSSSGSVFTVQIDGVSFQGSGLNDVAWGGTPLLGHVYTVKISTAAATDKFQWRKDGGAWSAEISMTGAAQALTDGVTITFAATTGHTLADLWNNNDTFKWKKDGGAWTAGVAITAALQTLGAEGVGITFAEKTGHTLNDIWAVTVEKSIRVNFCGLNGATGWPVYKNVLGIGLVAVDEGFVQNSPVTLTVSVTQQFWIFDNPALPVLTTVQPTFIIKEVAADHTVTAADARTFLNCSNSGVLTLDTCASLAGVDFWIASKDGTPITVNVAGGTDLIYQPFGAAGVASITVGGANTWDCVRLASNGAFLRVIEAVSPSRGYALFTIADTGNTWTGPYGLTFAKYTIGSGGGGGGGGGAANPGGHGGAGAVKTGFITPVPGTGYLITVGAGGPGGASGAPPGNGTAGGTTSLGALCSVAGGNPGLAGNGSPGADGDPADGTGDGISNYLAQTLGNYCNGGPGGSVGNPGSDGKDGFILLEW